MSDTGKPIAWVTRAELAAGAAGVCAALAGIGPVGRHALASKALLLIAVILFAISTYCAWRAYKVRRSKAPKV